MHTKLTIPERLKDLRVSEKRMSLQELSDATGIPSSTLGNYEKDENIDKMIENGLIEEVENLRRKYNHFPTAMQGLGYKEVVQYFQKELTKEEMIEKIKQESRRYAKRQLTWFRKNKQTIWIDGLANLEDNINIIEKELNK